MVAASSTEDTRGEETAPASDTSKNTRRNKARQVGKVAEDRPGGNGRGRESVKLAIGRHGGAEDSGDAYCHNQSAARYRARRT